MPIAQAMQMHVRGKYVSALRVAAALACVRGDTIIVLVVIFFEYFKNFVLFRRLLQAQFIPSSVRGGLPRVLCE